MPIVISVENLSKSYRLGQIGTGTLTNDLKVWWAKLRGKPNPLLKIGQSDHGSQDGETVWALKDVSFQVEQGEVLGIIGRNGAGKSTLLKILSRVTAPTSGQVKVKGRIASLLEVGTGFHPELTGRENIYLNGAILGMSKEEVRRKFDEIVAFAEVEKFIDTPVKRYSSGMYVRLAFAVAAHLDPEILIVDEVLAVGDAEFQKKCLGKIGEVSTEGRTVLFVSHNMGSINQLCRKALLLKQGRIDNEGNTRDVIDRYLLNDNIQNLDEDGLCESLNRTGIGGGTIEKLEIQNSMGIKTSTIGIGEPFVIRLHVRLLVTLKRLVVGLEVKTSDGYPVLNLRSDSQGIAFGPYSDNERIIFDVEVPGVHFYPGRYLIYPWFAEYRGKRIDYITDGIELKIESRGLHKAEQFLQIDRGIVIIDCNWRGRTNEEARIFC